MTVEAKCLVDTRTEPVGIRPRSKQSTRDFARFPSAHLDGLVGRLIQFAEIFGGYQGARRCARLLPVTQPAQGRISRQESERRDRQTSGSDQEPTMKEQELQSN